MSTVDQAFDSAFALLRQRYLSGLGAAVAELKKFAVLCEFDETSTQVTDSIGRLAHRLSGSGETLGYPEISSAAAELERILESGEFSGSAMASRARILARTCEAAMGISHGADAPKTTDREKDPAPPPADDPPTLPHFVVIHNDPAIARLLDDVCAGRASVTQFMTCAEAMDFLKVGRAELFFLDLDNPGCPPDGVAALHGQARASRIPIVATVSHRRSAAILHALSDGEIECVLKPADAALLHRKLFEILERQRLTAVICDDDPVAREFLKPRFEARGFQVVLAKDGEELLALAEQVRPSIIVLDRVMPGMDGLDTLRMLKAKPVTHKIPVIILTSRNQPGDMADGLRSGASAYLAKPFAPEQVLGKCLEILGLTKPQRA